MTTAAASRISDGTAALARGDWEHAREAFAAALEAGETAEAWEGLGWAAWWLSDEALTLRARETAYRAFRAEGDDGAAGRVAAWLVSDYREFRGEDAVARGWLVRAHRLLDPLPESADHGWLALNEGSFALNVELDPEAAARHARFAARLGRELGVADLEAVGLALDGIAEVIGGRVPEGMRLLDEASAIAAAEELRFPLSQGWALCYLIAACDGVGDFPRATQWCMVMREVAERWGARQLVGVCRSTYGRVLATSGDWVRAEGELVAAVSDLEATRPGQASGGLARLARASRAPGPHRRGARALRARRDRPACSVSATSPCTRVTRPTPPTPPSACCAASRPRTCSGACPRSSCSCAPAPSSAGSTRRARRSRISSAPARCSARRTCSGASGSSPAGSRTRAATTRRRAARARTRSTA